MAKLNDTHLILLSAAARRDCRNLWPLPDALADGAERAAKATASLIKRGLVEERETTDRSHVHRIDGDLRFGAYATDAGIAALDAGEVPAPGALSSSSETRSTKSSKVLDLLKRKDGATLAELIEVTGWLPHTTRAALTGLRKKGYDVGRTKRGDVTCYHLVA